MECSLNQWSFDELPHITWCLSGPLAFLPFHAAGVYSSTTGPKLFKLAVSSYTPSLSMLAEKYNSIGEATRSPRMLAISQPCTPGHTRLPGTEEEVKRVKQRVGHDIKWLNGEEATVEKVLSEMKLNNWCHFACHGVQHPKDPMESSFALHDGALSLRTMMSKAHASGEFAFLSACQTASGHEELPEEAVHLAAGMMAAGYQTVIATMWSIHDRDAPMVAEEVYSYLLKSGEDNTDGKIQRRRAAYALHLAQEKLRNQVGETNLVRWVPFVHFGV